MADCSLPRPVSLVTTVLNDRSGTALFLRAMETQTRLPNEVVVVDGGSTDGTWELLQSYRSTSGLSLKAIQVLGCNVARGRNLAIEMTSHELLASTDVGCSWDPNWLSDLVRPFEYDPKCEAVMGSWAVRPEALQGPWARTEFAYLRVPRMVATPNSHASSRSIAYTKTLWERIGGYPEDLTIAGDDMIFALLLHKASHRTDCAPLVLCYWDRPSSLKAFCKEARRNFKGVGEAGIWVDYGLKIGLRLLADLLAIPLGFVLLIPSARSWVLGLICLAGCSSIIGRLVRLAPAARSARSLGVSHAASRLVIFEYLIKIQAMHGYWEGFIHGRRQCVSCRERLRVAGI